jgi:ABC-2 type transport system ATP-binding protein
MNLQPENVLSAVGLKKKFGSTKAVNGISLEIFQGETVCVIGPNGAGKTTLLHLLGGIIMPNSGHITALGMHRWKDNFKIRECSIFIPATMIFGNFPTPFEFLRFVGQLYHLPKDEFHSRLENRVKEMNYQKHLHKPWSKLSLGLAKKAGLIAAFLPDLSLRLMDEPFAGGIDPYGMEMLVRWIAEASARGETTVFSTQVLEQTNGTGKLALICEGQLKFYGTLEEMLKMAGVEPGETRAISKAFIALTGNDL